VLGMQLIQLSQPQKEIMIKRRSSRPDIHLSMQTSAYTTRGVIK
jgi:hypothetical protein